MVGESLFWFLEVTVNNAHIIYKMHTNTRTKLTMKDFRRELAVELCSEVCHGNVRGRLHADQSLERLRGSHFIQKGTKRRDCHVCSDQNPGGGRKTVNTFCMTCSDQPPLCIGECFRKYHTRATF